MMGYGYEAGMMGGAGFLGLIVAHGLNRPCSRRRLALAKHFKK